MPSPASLPDPTDPISAAHREWVEHGWGDAADGMAAVTSLFRVHQLISERIDRALREHGLTFARYEILRLLAFTRTGSMPMARMGSYLQVHPTSVSSAVTRLEAQGYVERQRRAADGRVVLATITPAGRRLAEITTKVLNTTVFSDPGLPDESMVGVLDVFWGWRERLGDLGPH